MCEKVDKFKNQGEHVTGRNESTDEGLIQRLRTAYVAIKEVLNACEDQTLQGNAEERLSVCGRDDDTTRKARLGAERLEKEGRKSLT